MTPTPRHALLALPLALGLQATACATTPATPAPGDAASPGAAPDAAATQASSPASATPTASAAPSAPAPSASPEMAPSVRFLTLGDGQERGLEAFSGVRVVTFWATWCGHCQAELPKLDPWAKAEARAGWAWVPIEASQGSKEEVAKFKTDYKIQGELYFDPSGATAKAFGIGSYPTTVVLDAQGKVIFKKVGATGPEAFQPYLPAK